MKAAKEQFDAMKEMQTAGIEIDVQEADIVLKYTQAFKNLSEVNANYAAQVQAIEDNFINQSEGGLTDGH